MSLVILGQGSPDSNTTGLIKGGGGFRHRGARRENAKGQVELCCHQTRSHQKPGEGPGTDPSRRPAEGAWPSRRPANSAILNFWPPERQENTFVLCNPFSVWCLATAASETNFTLTVSPGGGGPVTLVRPGEAARGGQEGHILRGG